MAKSKIIDMDEVLVPERIIKITGKKDKVRREIDVSEIPSRVVLELMRGEENLKKKITRQNDDVFSWMMGIAIKICKPSFKEISEDWMLDNMDFERLHLFLQTVLEPLNEFIDGAVKEAKKTLAAQEETEV